MPAVMASTGGGGGRWPSPAQNECFFMSPLQSYQGSYQGSFQGGNWRKQGGCNKYIFTNAELPVVRPAVCWCGPLRRSSPDYITTNIKTLAFTGTRATLPVPGRVIRETFHTFHGKYSSVPPKTQTIAM